MSTDLCRSCTRQSVHIAIYMHDSVPNVVQHVLQRRDSVPMIMRKCAAKGHRQGLVQSLVGRESFSHGKDCTDLHAH